MASYDKTNYVNASYAKTSYVTPPLVKPEDPTKETLYVKTFLTNIS